MDGRQKVSNEYMPGIGVNEINAGVISSDVDVTMGVGDQTAGEWLKMHQSRRKCALEKSEESINWERRTSKEAPLLNVMAREHWEIGSRQFEISKARFLLRNYSAFRDDSH